MPKISTVERAFQIAQSRSVESIPELRRVLSREGYHDAVAQTSFPAICRQLRQAIVAAKEAASDSERGAAVSR